MEKKRLFAEAVLVTDMTNPDLEHDEFVTKLAAKAEGKHLKEFASTNGVPTSGDKSTLAHRIAEWLRTADMPPRK